MHESPPHSGKWTTRQTRNVWTVALWTVAWLLSLALANLGPQLLWDNVGMSIFSVAANLATGVGMVLANRRLIMDLDEMQRQVQLQAMAVALGVGLVFGLAYATLDVVNVIPFRAEIPHLIALISLVFCMAVWLGMRRLK